MKRLIAIIAITATFGMTAAMAQDGRCDAITGKVTDVLTKGGGVSVKFSSRTISGNRAVQEMQGSIRIKGEKFVLLSDAMDMGYDGQTAWSYIKGSGEVNLSEPAEEELATLNPYILLSNYKRMYKAEYKGKKNGYETITLIPLSDAADIKGATVTVDAGSGFPTRLETVNRDASKTVISISDFESAVKNDDSIFVFSESNYPDIEIIDLR